MKLSIPKTIREAGIDEKEFCANLDQLSENAFADQYTGDNPRYPLISELKGIYVKAYEDKQ